MYLSYRFSPLQQGSFLLWIVLREVDELPPGKGFSPPERFYKAVPGVRAFPLSICYSKNVQPQENNLCQNGLDEAEKVSRILPILSPPRNLD